MVKIELTKQEMKLLNRWGDSVKHNFTWTEKDEELLKRVEEVD